MSKSFSGQNKLKLLPEGVGSSVGSPADVGAIQRPEVVPIQGRVWNTVLSTMDIPMQGRVWNTVLSTLDIPIQGRVWNTVP
jgi:hypothetical protein